MLGYSEEELKAFGFRAVHLSEERFQDFAPQYRRLVETGLVNIDYPFRRKDGSTFLCSLFGTLLDPAHPDAGFIWNLLDVSALHDAQAAVRQLSRAVQQTPTSVVITDLEGRMTFVNKAFCRVSGYEEHEILGKNPRVLKSGRMEQSIYKQMWETLARGQEWHGELQNRRKNGEIFWESAVISPLTDDDGNVTHYLAVKEDISERKRAEAELQANALALETTVKALEESNRRAEDATQAKSEFLANMSHEIRTPMNGVIGMTGLLLDTQLTAEQRKYAEIVRSSAESLLMLINDILDFSKIEADNLELETLDFDLPRRPGRHGRNAGDSRPSKGIATRSA